MCPPTYFDIEYSINAWMDPKNKVDHVIALQQWQRLFDTYQSLGFEVETIAPVEHLPDMVFTTDNGLIFGNRVVLGRFLYSERQGETERFAQWFKLRGFRVHLPSTVFEGGDIRVLGSKIFIGYGFRTNRQVHSEIADFFDREVISLRLVDKRFYHMDTALCGLDKNTAMYFPAAFDDNSVKLLKEHIPNLIEASEADALTFGLNAFSDGHNVIASISNESELSNQLRQHGFNPISVDISEFQKSGGGINCLTLELRS